MKIVHICLSMGYTEGLNYQENVIIKYQAKDGHDVTLITTDHCFHEGEWGVCRTESDYINPDGVHIIRLPFAFPIPYKINKQIGIFKGFYPLLEQIHPDVIFVHNLQFQDLRTVGKYKKRHPDVKVNADNHSDFSNSARNWLSRNTLYRLWWKPCAKAVEKYVDTFFGVMPSRVDFLHNVYGIAPKKTDLLVMGADDEAVSAAADPLVKKKIRQQYGIDDEDFLILTGGKIDSFKTQTLLLMEAVKQMNREGTLRPVKLLVFGAVEEALRKRFDDLCDGVSVQYIGWANNSQSYEYFASADLVVFPGRHSVYWEQVVAQGIPMLCKYWEGTTHVDIGGNVRFLKEDSVELLKYEIMRLVELPDAYDEMKRAALSEGRRDFSYEEIARKSIQ